MRPFLVATLLAAATGSAQPARLHVIRLGGPRGNGFNPARVIARPGDTLRFVNGSGGLHNVEFPPDSISREAARLLERAMPQEKMDSLSGPLLVMPDDVYQFVVPRLPPGRYPFRCRPHYLTGMTGELIIQ